jgi:hypothetical protein
MFWKKKRPVGNGKVRSQSKNKFNKKFAIHKRPWKCTTDEHAEHEPLDLNFLLLADPRWIHVLKDASALGWWSRILLWGSFVGIVKWSMYLIQLC